MFDYLESTFNEEQEFVFLIKYIRNKRYKPRNFLYLSGINHDGSLRFTKGLENARMINPKDDHYYYHIKIRAGRIHCGLIRMTKLQYYKSVERKRETWWDHIKVWFSRKFIKKE